LVLLCDEPNVVELSTTCNLAIPFYGVDA
jgi:hypothetical protein